MLNIIVPTAWRKLISAWVYIFAVLVFNVLRDRIHLMTEWRMSRKMLASVQFFVYKVNEIRL